MPPSLKLIEGFDYISNTSGAIFTDLQRNGWGGSGGTYARIDPGRNSQGYALQLSDGPAFIGRDLSFSLASTGLILGFGLNVTSAPASPKPVVTLKSSGSPAGHLSIDTSGKLYYIPDSFGTTLGNAVYKTAATIPFGSWSHVAFQLRAATSATGTIQIFINGQSATDETTNQQKISGVVTSAFGTPNHLQFNQAGQPTNIDDLYTADDLVFSTSPFGDVRAITKVGSTVDVNDMTVVGAANAVDATKDIPANTTSYVHSSTSTHKTTLNMETFGIGASDALHGVMVQALAQDVGGASTGLKLLNKGTTATSFQQFNLQSSWGYVRYITQVDPDTGLAWVSTDLDGTKFGVEIP